MSLLQLSDAIRGNQFVLDGHMIGKRRSQGLSGCAKGLAERVRGGAKKSPHRWGLVVRIVPLGMAQVYLDTVGLRGERQKRSSEISGAKSIMKLLYVLLDYLHCIRWRTGKNLRSGFVTFKV